MSVVLIKFIDKYLGSVLCFFLSLIPQKEQNKKLRKILFIQLWSIGESILTLPAIFSAKNKASVEVLTTNRGEFVFKSAKIKYRVIGLNPFSILIFIFSNYRKYDLVIDFEEYLNISSILAFFIGKNRIGFDSGLRSKLYNNKVKYNSEQHVTKTFLDLISIAKFKRDEALPKLYYKKSKKLERILTSKKSIGIVPGAAESAKSRMWPAEKYAELIDELRRNKFKGVIYLIGSEAEEEISKTILRKVSPKLNDKENLRNLTGKISLDDLLYLIDNLDLLISNDTGPIHIASILNTKTIGLYGPNTPVRFGPLAKKSVAIYNKNSCDYSPCINVHLGQVPDCLFQKNTEDYQKCMKSIWVKDVLKAVNSLILHN